MEVSETRTDLINIFRTNMTELDVFAPKNTRLVNFKIIHVLRVRGSSLDLDLVLLQCILK